jgi:hypothetical protein
MLCGDQVEYVELWDTERSFRSAVAAKSRVSCRCYCKNDEGERR